ncbi:hypothetical protein [Paenibacillus terrae]|uniref:Uncharacterized protein n=1 Tax=Paenibacillus terrae TaxID=159743 RepID=A0A0D7X648_9BACL|nr:hypothetical protein [Paenibacillus terrae]KJD46704.1 hypothetical protein QD47_05480 [Paenibacillus terrae]
MGYSKEVIFKEQINDVISHDWKIVYNPETDTTKIINEKGDEISPSSLGFIGSEISDYINRREEEKCGEKRKTPLDEFTIKRFGIQDYVLIEESSPLKSILEAYHNQYCMFILEKFSVSPQNNLKYSEFDVCLSVAEAEKILVSLQNFVEKNKR